MEDVPCKFGSHSVCLFKRMKESRQKCPHGGRQDAKKTLWRCCLGKMHQDNFPQNQQEQLKQQGYENWYTLKLWVQCKQWLLVDADMHCYLLMNSPAMWRSVSSKKSEVFTKFRQYRAAVEKQTGACIKRFRSDNDSEYVNKAFNTRSSMMHEFVMNCALHPTMGWRSVWTACLSTWHAAWCIKIVWIKSGGLKLWIQSAGSCTASQMLWISGHYSI